MLTTDYRSQTWGLFHLTRDDHPLLGAGWAADFTVEDDDGEVLTHIQAHALDSSPGLWAIHYMWDDGQVSFSHGFGSLGITLVPVVPPELVELINLAFVCGFEHGDDVAQIGMAQALPKMLELGGQLRLAL